MPAAPPKLHPAVPRLTRCSYAAALPSPRFQHLALPLPSTMSASDTRSTQGILAISVLLVNRQGLMILRMLTEVNEYSSDAIAKPQRPRRPEPERGAHVQRRGSPGVDRAVAAAPERRPLTGRSRHEVIRPSSEPEYL